MLIDKNKGILCEGKNGSGFLIVGINHKNLVEYQKIKKISFVCLSLCKLNSRIKILKKIWRRG
jgi:hypothetical protein